MEKKKKNNNKLINYNSFDNNVFIMMRYSNANYFKTIEKTIIKSLSKYNMNACFAKDSDRGVLLWENVKYYMNACKYGIAVFEEIDDKYFNPNVSLELGYMFAQNKRCLLLKEQRISNLQTDLCGHIYKIFDIMNIKETIRREIDRWIKDDLRYEYILLKEKIKGIFNSYNRNNITKKSILIILYTNPNGCNINKIRTLLLLGYGDKCSLIKEILSLKDLEMISVSKGEIYTLTEKGRIIVDEILHD